MLGLVIFSLLISLCAFKTKPPFTRALHTVFAALVCQIVVGVTYSLMMRNTLTRRGLELESIDWAEFIITWVVGMPIFGLIIGTALWWSYKRKWTDDVTED